ncbi:MAG: 50S ribosomal protein L29 [Holosporaceae bacterium]|jgi:ribosomal protein L29|nr:50S ribosomal protein L29 [Holosporaceae bacterium]
MSKDEAVDVTLLGDLENAKREAMRLRFRKVLGEGAAPHVIRAARKKVAKCARLVKNCNMGSKNA